MTRTSKYECERDDEVRSFDSFEDCRRFVLREGDRSRLWSYVGLAAAVYGLGFEPTAAQVREHFAAPSYREAWAEKQSIRT